MLFFDQGTGSIDFVDGPNGPILCLKQGDSKNDEQICLYRRISNNELDFEDGNGDKQKQYEQTFKQVGEWVMDSSVSIEVDDEPSLESVSKQSSNSTLASAHTSGEENEFDTSIQLKTSLLDECVTCILYQCPLKATMMFEMISACVLTLINCITRMPTIQLASLPSVMPESDVASLWQHKSPLHIKLIENKRNMHDHQGLKLTCLYFVENFLYHVEVVLDGDDRDQSSVLTDLENQRHSNRDGEDNVLLLQERDHIKKPDQDSSSKVKNEKEHLSSNQVFESLSSTNELVFESMYI
jgi:hypothetical protein